MRWKWLLVITILISLTALSVQGNDDEEEKVVAESVSENPPETEGDDKAYDDDEEENKNDENKDPVDDPSEPVNIMKAEESTNEDSVDVGNVSQSKKKGRYYNYDDYLASAIDGSDNNYDWNSEY